MLCVSRNHDATVTHHFLMQILNIFVIYSYTVLTVVYIQSNNFETLTGQPLQIMYHFLMHYATFKTAKLWIYNYVLWFIWFINININATGL